MIKHNVLLFGPLCDKFEANRIEVELPENSTISDLIESINLQEYTLKSAINGVIVDHSTILEEKCEIALLPPVSGG